MGSVEKLSDKQLRERLIEHGFVPGPITQTTRKLLENKLINLMSQNGKKKGDAKVPKAAYTLARFSSAEEESDDGNQNSRRQNMPAATKRKSMGRTARMLEASRLAEQQSDNILMPKPPNPSVKSGRSRYSVNDAASKKTDVKSPSYRPFRKDGPVSSTRIGDGFDTGSESDSASYAASESPQEIDEEEDKSITSLLSDVSNKFLPKKGSTPKRTLEASSNTFKNRFSLPRESSIDAIDSPPYLSAFARRLQQLKVNPPPLKTGASVRSRSSLYDDVKESDSDDNFDGASSSNGHYANPHVLGRTRLPPKRMDPSRLFKTTEETLGFWRNSHVMSFLILGIFAFCFISILVVYLNMAAKVSLSPYDERGTGNVYKICKGPDDVPRVTCVLPEAVAPAVDLLDVLYSDLMARAVQSKCGPMDGTGSYPKPYLTVREAVKLMVGRKELSIWEAEEQVDNLVVLIASNPHWGIAVTDKAVKLPDVTKLSVDKPDIPLKCSLTNMASDVLAIVAFVGSGLCTVYALFLGGKWWLESRERNKREVCKLVERIVEVLSSHHVNLTPHDEPYLAISHIRDQIIGPSQRKKMLPVWEEAVKFIRKEDSRVREEVQTINGEDYTVWRWLPPKHNSSVVSSVGESPIPQSGTNTTSANGSRRKVWQGQAFEKGSVNSPPVSPTPCLKVRHMFDPDIEFGDNWPEDIQDAILEKCVGAKILHIAVDKSSKEGLVYIKCASEEDAGKSYMALHGDWFDGQLVTVKYLRLERYHERFPDAIKARHQLHPRKQYQSSKSYNA